MSVPKGTVVSTNPTSLSVPKGKQADRGDHQGPQGEPSAKESDLNAYKRKLNTESKKTEELTRTITNVKLDVAQLQDENADQLQGGQIYGADDHDQTDWALEVVSVQGSTAFVNGGFGQIDGIGRWDTICPAGALVPGTGPTGGVGNTETNKIQQYTLPLNGSVAYVYVRMPIGGGVPEIGMRNDMPDAKDGIYHYRVLCKCVPTKPGSYIIVRRGFRGDFIESAPIGTA
jgi:hypothetical protein